MKYHKKTIALVLASVISIAGSFAANNYKNSLMALSFESGTNGAVSVIVQTKNQYSGNVTPIKKDANTYVLMLPEIDSLAPTPDLSKTVNIESVNIRTLPYSTNGKGYTKVVIKTSNSTTLFGESKIYLPPKESDKAIENYHNETVDATNYETRNRNFAKPQQTTVKSREKNVITAENTSEEMVQKDVTSTENDVVEEIPNTEEDKINVDENNNDTVVLPEKTSNNSTEQLYLIMGVLFVLMTVILLVLRANNKMKEIAGQDFDNDKEVSQKDIINYKKNSPKTISQTIKSLDSKISQTSNYADVKKYIDENKKVEHIENIVDLDTLFKEEVLTPEKTKEQNNTAEKQTENTQEDLEDDFLMNFIDLGYTKEAPQTEENLIEEAEKQTEADLELEKEFQEIIQNGKIKFSNEDIEKINILLNSEIDSETLKNVKKYVASNPIQKDREREKRFEDIITTYAVSCNVIFDKDDLNILKQLVNIELPLDFVKDLRTNSAKTKEMEKEILKEKKQKPLPKPEILKVKDSLPDIATELKKLGNRRIESNAKPSVVYYTEGYDCAKLAVNKDVSDINFSEYSIDNQTKEKEPIKYLDNSYVVEQLHTAELDLPDLQDAIENPHKYKNEIEIFIPDEKVLMNNIKNVTIKPWWEEEKTISTEKKPEKQSDKTEKEFAPEKEIKPNISDKTEVKEQIERKQEKALPQTEKQTETASDCTKYIYDNKTFIIKSSATFDDNSGCHLAYNENEGYIVFAYIGEKISQINSFLELKSNKIQARLSETSPDGTKKYIIRIGMKKFVVELKDNEIKYIMDLC